MCAFDTFLLKQIAPARVSTKQQVTIPPERKGYHISVSGGKEIFEMIENV